MDKKGSISFLMIVEGLQEDVMSNKREQIELDKDERIKKHERSHKVDHEANDNNLERLGPKHKPSKKNHVNILDAYEKFGEMYDGLDE